MKNKRLRGPGQSARTLALVFALALAFVLALAVVLILAFARIFSWMEGREMLSPIQAWAAQETVTYESPIFTDDGENLRPKEILEREGKQYRLVSTRIKSAIKEGTLTYASASIPYVLEGNQEPPETAWITLKDDTTGEEYEREVPCQEIREKDSLWTDDFMFLITVSGYDADVFWIGDTEIPANAELSDYGDELLRYLGLPKDCYQVKEVIWKGESYEKDGILCRDAEAKGSKLIRNVEVKYGGQVKTPEIKGKQYVGIYEEIVPETEESEPEMTEPEKEEIEETVSEESAVSEPEETVGAARQILYWLKNHLTVVTIGAGFFLFLLAASILFWMFCRKSRTD